MPDNAPTANVSPDSSVSGTELITPSPHYSSTPPLIPDHEMLRRIGAGSYGEVWLARNVLGQYRAVKIVHRKTFNQDKPYKREFNGLKKFEPISHARESQVDIFHVGRNDSAGFFYYIMELADDATSERSNGVMECWSGGGKPESQHSKTPTLQHAGSYAPRTLRHDLRTRGALSVAECVQIALSLTRALEHLHAHGLVHRDIKPSNIIFVKGVPKLADIGLVTSVDATRSFVGTDGYIPPEGPGTPPADLYSLGKVLYECVTGKDRLDFPELPADWRTRPDFDQLLEFNEILTKACDNDARQRYQSAEEMRTDLDRLAEGNSVRRAHQVERRWTLVRRSARGLAVGAGALTLIVLASRVWQRPPANPKVEKRSTNEVANRFYVLGRHYFEKNNVQDSLTATTNFERAVQADPGFAPAHAALAMAYLWSGNGSGDYFVLLPAAKDAALKALKLDDSLSEPHIVLGWHRIFREWKWSEAQAEFKRAIQLNPSGGNGYHFYAEFLRMTGQTNEALVNISQALKLEPSSITFNRRLAVHLLAARRYEDASKQADQATAMEPNTSSSAYMTWDWALRALGRYGEAIETERKNRRLDGESPEKIDATTGQLKEAFAAEGPKGYWRVRLELEKREYWRACAYAQMGKTAEAIERLQAALKQRDFWLTFYVMTDWTLDPLRSDPRFHAILKEMGLE